MQTWTDVPVGGVQWMFLRGNGKVKLVRYHGDRFISDLLPQSCHEGMQYQLPQGAKFCTFTPGLPQPDRPPVDPVPEPLIEEYTAVDADGEPVRLVRVNKECILMAYDKTWHESWSDALRLAFALKKIR